jgi:hypothetical protein
MASTAAMATAKAATAQHSPDRYVALMTPRKPCVPTFSNEGSTDLATGVDSVSTDA